MLNLLNKFFKRFSCLLLLFNVFTMLCGQNPAIKLWDKRYGGSDGDLLKAFKQTSDRGYILGGYSTSGISGNKTEESFGGQDYYIVKTDSLGIIQWDKDFGGTNDDLLQAVSQTADGGFILGGTSWSDSSGNKSQSSWGIEDYWVVKTDSLGNIEWDRDFGGTSSDVLNSVMQTFDGGYILGGYSYSDSSGDKTQPVWGNRDYWIVKIDSSGNKEWDRDFGGTDDDALFSVVQTADSGYMLGGYSSSGIGGDKTQQTVGGYDYWIVKLDSQGNYQWDKDFGGTSIDGLYVLQQTFDHGYILGGVSISGIGGDKSEPSWGAYDYWIIKIDSLGNKQWDRDFGGTDNEEVFSNISQTNDSGYLISGSSYSGIGGNKTENNIGQEQSWTVKTDALGNIEWDKTALTPGHDEGGFAIQTKDNCYAVANSSDGGIGGYKSQPSWNNSDDYWIVKFCDSSIITGFPVQLQKKQLELTCFPNPNSGRFAVNLNNQIAKDFSIRIINHIGQIIHPGFVLLNRGKVNTVNSIDVEVADLSQGVYVIEMKNNEMFYRGKFIKQ